MSTITVDLRSDTVTRPTPAMWDAMRAAPLGDDVLGDEPSVQAFESAVADRLGKEAGLFTPSGTMANQLAIRGACEPGDEIIAHRESHIIHYETGAPAALSGCMIAPLDGPGGVFEPASVHRAIRHRDIHAPRSKFLSIENSHNRGGGAIWTVGGFAAVANAGREHGLHVHVDGARLFNAAIGGGYDAKVFASHADTLSVCFSKGLGAPVGSVLVGPAAFIERCRRFRKMFGGGMRQSGLLAAAGLFALKHHVERLAEDHANATRLADGLGRIEGIDVEPVAGGVRTNIVFFRVADHLGGAPDFARRLGEHGIAMIALDPDRVRAVTHLDVTREQIDQAVAVASDLVDH
jgi:threonine aldolase